LPAASSWHYWSWKSSDMKLGATGKFPDDKISADDEGELTCAISSLPNGNVRIDFGKDVKWIVLSRELGFQFAREIMRRCVDQVISLESGAHISSTKKNADIT
jgi:hypothetical protein